MADTPIEIIELWPMIAECHICDTECPMRYSLAMYEDMIVTDDYSGEWLGAPVCERCYRAAVAIQLQAPGEILYQHVVRKQIGESQV